MTATLLVLAYPFLLLARVLNMMSGRDPLRFVEPEDSSLWIPRSPAQSDATYFAETSPAEGAGAGGWERIPEAILLFLARWNTPSRSQPREKFSAASREEGIPDEMYTLW